MGETICASKQLVGSHYFTLPLQRDLYQTEFLKKQREERDKSSLIQACRKYLLKTNSEESEICMGSNANIDENKDDENRSFNEILTEISKGLISKRTDNKKKKKTKEQLKNRKSNLKTKKPSDQDNNTSEIIPKHQINSDPDANEKKEMSKNHNDDDDDDDDSSDNNNHGDRENEDDDNED